MKKIRTLLIATLIAIFALSMFACASKISLTFETNGGNNIPGVEVTKDSEYTLPIPTRDGYAFEGWYLSADFSGEPVVNYVAKSNTKFYAKWAKTYKISLIKGEGSLSIDELELKAGEDLYAFMQNYLPTLDNYKAFWFNEEVELTPGYLMPAAPIELNARYKIKYTIESYLQNLEGTSYVKDDVDVEGYGFKNTIVNESSAPARQGFQINTSAEGAHNSITLSENVGQNVLRFYYDRLNRTVTYVNQYPNKPAGANIVETYKYDAQATVISSLTTDAYFLAGWATSQANANAGTIAYKTNYIKANLYFATEEVSAESLNVTSNITLYPVWKKGYTDVFRGKDYIFIDETDPDVVYLLRAGFFFKGELREEQQFLFRVNEDFILQGKILSDSTYAYSSQRMSQSSSTLFVAGSGLIADTWVSFDSYNAITYTTRVDNTTYNSVGTYIIDDDGYVIAQFTTGEFTGQTKTLLFGTVGGYPAFQIRDEDEVALGPISYVAVENGTLTKMGLTVTLNGFGVATFSSGQVMFYSHDKLNRRITLQQDTGATFATITLVDEFGGNCFAFYYETLDGTIVNNDGNELTLDGMYTATYKNTDKSIESTGNYWLASSLFGGTVVSLTDKNDGTTYTLLIYAQGDYLTFDERASGYAEYRYKDKSGMFHAPLMVINDIEGQTNSASLYGYTSAGTYEKVSTGTYTLVGTQYTYQAQNYLTAKNVLTNPFDLSDVSSISFLINSTTTDSGETVLVHYWTSWTSRTNGEQEVDARFYTSTTDDSTLEFIAGYVVYTNNAGVSNTYTYTESNDIITIVAGSEVLYVELNTTTFTKLSSVPYSAVLLKNGMQYNSVKLSLDGKGGGVYTIEGQDPIIGTVEITSDLAAEGTSYQRSIYNFIVGGEVVKRFILLPTSNVTYFAEYDDTYAATYTIEGTTNTLSLDGFGLMAILTEGTTEHEILFYAITDVNIVNILVNNQDRFYEVIEPKTTLAPLGDEYGRYLMVDNFNSQRLYIEFDGKMISGRGTILIYERVENEEGITAYYCLNPENPGYYELNNGIYTISYTINGKLTTRLGKIRSYIINSQEYRYFAIIQEDIQRVYINENNWVVMILDDVGNATRYSTIGVEKQGIYTLISEEMLYFASNDETEAGLYKYDTQNGLINSVEFTNISYYTYDFDSLRFTPYGYAIFNGGDSYYYDIVDGKAIIYRPATEEDDPSDITKYGYVEEEFGPLDIAIRYNEEWYYKNTGQDIVFKRHQDNLTDYPILAGDASMKFTTLSFAPSGFTFDASASVTIDIGEENEARQSARVVRTSATEAYLAYDNYRFDIEFYYYINQDTGENESYFIVNSMSYFREITSFDYLKIHADIYSSHGAAAAEQVKNILGTISIIREYNIQGTQTAHYLVSDFGKECALVDSEGNVVSINKDNIISFSDNTTAANGVSTVEFSVDVNGQPEIYRFYFQIPGGDYAAQYGQGFLLSGYTRLETFDLGNDTSVVIERISADCSTILFDSPFSIGEYFSMQLTYQGEDIEASEFYVLELNRVALVARKGTEQGGTTRITETTYYVVDFTLEQGSGSIEDSLLDILDVSLVEITATTYQTATGFSYVDFVNDEIVVAIYNSDPHVVTEFNKTGANTYTITATSLTTGLAADFNITTSAGNILTINKVI